MNDQINRKIAEALGWTDINFYEDNAGPGFWNGLPLPELTLDGKGEWAAKAHQHHKHLPDFAGSLDACLPLIEFLRQKGWTVQLGNGLDGTWEAEVSRPARPDSPKKHVGVFHGETRELYYEPEDTAPLALCGASLRMLGLWED